MTPSIAPNMPILAERVSSFEREPRQQVERVESPPENAVAVELSATAERMALAAHQLRTDLTIDSDGNELFRVINEESGEVERQYPEETILKIREYVALLDRAQSQRSESSYSVSL